jgi:hypothetical protein
LIPTTKESHTQKHENDDDVKGYDKLFCSVLLYKNGEES